MLHVLYLAVPFVGIHDLHPLLLISGSAAITHMYIFFVLFRQGVGLVIFALFFPPYLPMRPFHIYRLILVNLFCWHILG